MNKTTLHDFLLKLHNETLIRVWKNGEGPAYEGNVEDLLAMGEHTAFERELLYNKVYFVYGTLEEKYMNIVISGTKSYLKTLLHCEYEHIFSLKEENNL